MPIFGQLPFFSAVQVAHSAPVRQSSAADATDQYHATDQRLLIVELVFAFRYLCSLPHYWSTVVQYDRFAFRSFGRHCGRPQSYRQIVLLSMCAPASVSHHNALS